MIERPTWQELFKNMILDLSRRSTCVRLQVGSILVRDGRVISMGYNGVTKGHDHCNVVFQREFEKSNYTTFEEYLQNDKFKNDHHSYSTRYELHSEQNMLMFCAKNGIATDGAEAYITHSPCIHCAKMLYASGISKVYYIYPYERDMSGVEFLEENNIKCEMI